MDKETIRKEVIATLMSMDGRKVADKLESASQQLIDCFMEQIKLERLKEKTAEAVSG